MKIQDMLLTSKKARPKTKRGKTTKIAIHWVGNAGSSAKNNRDYFNNSGVSASSHYIVGLDGEIIRCVPEDEIAYTTNSANSYSIGIENCHPDWTGKFNDKTYNSLVELCADLCKRYKLNPLDDLIRHYDVTKKCCPKWFVDNPKEWNKFKNDVKECMHSDNEVTNEANEKTENKPKVLNINPKTKSDWVKRLQTYLNNTYGAKLKVDGYVGPATYAAVKNKAIGKKYITKGTLVKLLQEALGGLDIDGSCGPATQARIKEYQKDNKLTVDGSFGPASWKKLFNM